MGNNRAIRLGSLSLVVLALFACEGGGCQGMEPIPAGFDTTDRVEHAAQVRLTDSGLRFLETSLFPIVSESLPDGIEVPVPEKVKAGPLDIVLCETADCLARITLESLTLTPSSPNHLAARVLVGMDSRNGNGDKARWDGTCDLEIDTSRGDRPVIGMDVEVALVEETEGPRAGYTRVEVERVEIAEGYEIEGDDIDFSGLIGVCNVFDWVQGLLVGAIEGQLQSVVDSALCQKRGPVACPPATYAVPDENDPESVCRFGPAEEDRCVPILLGVEGQADLGQALLSSISPGALAPVQFLAAATGDLESAPEGVSLSVGLGLRSMDEAFELSPGHNPCVPETIAPPKPQIPRVNAFRSNGGVSEEDVHVSLGIAEDFLNYAAYHFFDSGGLCLSAGTELSQQLSSGLFSLLIPEIRELTFPTPSAPIRMAVRPQAQPVFEIGEGSESDPLLSLSVPSLEVDIYAYMSERYVRFMTLRTNLKVALNLETQGDVLAPTIVRLEATGSEVSHSALLREDPKALAELLESLVGQLAGSIADSLGEFTLPEIMGMGLWLPNQGITAVEAGPHEFLALALRLTRNESAPARTETEASLVEVRLDPRAQSLATFAQADPGEVTIEVNSATGLLGYQRLEVSTRVDKGPWSPWTDGPQVRVRSNLLKLEGRHEVQVRTRLAGLPETTDRTPAVIPVTVDHQAPVLRLSKTDTPDVIALVAADIVDPARALSVRVRPLGGKFGPFAPLDTLPVVDGRQNTYAISVSGLPHPNHVLSGHASYEVQVRDSSGLTSNARIAMSPARAPVASPSKANTGASMVVAQETLAPRGLELPGCAVTPAPQHGRMPAWMLCLGLAVIGAWRRRTTRRHRAHARNGATATRRWNSLRLAAFLVALLSGCSCNDAPACANGCEAAPEGTTLGQICCPSRAMCVNYDLVEVCAPGYACKGPEHVRITGSCELSCDACELQPPLDEGVMATHTDHTVMDNGDVIVSGYAPGVLPGQRYGDLVVGRIAAGTDALQFTLVDGVPAEGRVNGDPDGFRRGIIDPGDDVGRYSSITHVGETLYISYYDATHGHLRVASGPLGELKVRTIDDEGDAGRYSSIAATPNGRVAVAYLGVALDESSGAVTSQVRVAELVHTESTADFRVRTVFSAPMPCRPEFCGEAQACLETGLCAPEDERECDPGCEDGMACVAGACEKDLADSFIEDRPPAVGVFTRLAQLNGAWVLAFQDNQAGRVMISYESNGAFVTPIEVDSGMAGAGLSLAIDEATQTAHLAYQKRATGALVYTRVQLTGNAPQIDRYQVDRGLGPVDEPFLDGRHVVGEDTAITLRRDGTLRIAYQDATAGHAKMATFASTGDPAFQIEVLDDTETSGFFVRESEVLGAAGAELVTTLLFRTPEAGVTRVLRTPPAP